MPIVLNRFLKFATIILLLITCTSCKVDETYTNIMWLKDISLQAGIGDYTKGITYYEDISKENEYYPYVQALVEWGVIKKDDVIDFSDDLRFDFVVYTISNLLFDKQFEYKEINQTIIDEFNNHKLYDDSRHHFSSGDIISKEVALKILDNAVNILNNPKIDKYVDVKYKSSQKERLEDVEYLKISDSFEIDFDDVYIEDVHDVLEEHSIYDNDFYNRRSTQLLSKVFEYDGYRVSYSINKNRMHFRVSKKTERGLNLYFDGDIFNLRPSYKLEIDKQKIKNAFFKIDYQTSEELGLEQSKLPQFYGDLSSLGSESLFSRLKNLIKPKSDLLETSFTVCKIHIPIKELPSAEIELELKLNIYVGGKVEFALSTNHQNGLEIKDGHLRIINNNHYDGDFIINANTSLTVSLKALLKFLDTDLLDVKSKAGIKALAKTTLHLYDSKGRLYTEKLDLDYSLVDDLVSDKEALYTCVDLSLYWLLNLSFNSEGTLAYTLGFNKNIDILDEDNQVFGNLSHLENGLFKEKCSYLNNRNRVDLEEIVVKPNRIILDTYSIVLKNEKKDININSLPEGYQINDICYEVEDKTIVKVIEHQLHRLKPGVTKIRIYTNDNKYEVYLNVLVSDG